MSFMVGSFAAGLSEGLDSGWKLGKDIQAYSREEEIRSATKKAQEDAKAKAALPSVAAKAPSVNDPDVSGPAGLSAGQTNLTETGWEDPTAHPDATTPPTLDKDGNAVPKTAATNRIEIALSDLLTINNTPLRRTWLQPAAR